MADDFPAFRHPARKGENQPTQRINIVFFIWRREIAAHGFFEIIDKNARIGFPDRASVLARDDLHFGLLFVMFVVNIADNGFNQILNRDQPVCAAIFIHHDGHMYAPSLHPPQQILRQH